MKFRHLLGIFVVLSLIYSLSYGSTSQTDETEYFALFMDNLKIGHAIQDRIVEGDKVTTSIKLSITINRTGIPVSISISSVSIETTDGKPIGFEIEQDLGILTMKTVGNIDENGKMTITTGQQKEERQWPEGALMSEGLRLLYLKNGLKEGTRYTAKIFEPSTMEVFNAEVNIGAKTTVDLLGRVVELTEIKSTTSSGQIATLNTVEYYDDEMKLQKSVTPVMGFTIEQIACSKEFALGENDVFEVVDKMFLSSPEPIENVSSVKSITYYLSQTGTNDLKIPSNDNQKVKNLSNGNVVVTIEPITAPTGIRFPYKGSDSTATDALKPTRYVESDEQIIKDLAKEAIEDLLTWLAKQPKESVDKAIQDLGLGVISEEELKSVIKRIVEANATMVTERGERAIGPLMGLVMKEVRGRADGKLVSELLRSAVQAHQQS